MFDLFEMVVVSRNIPAAGLITGDVGNIVDIIGGGQLIEVEFINAQAAPVATVTLLPTDLKKTTPSALLNERAFAH